MLPPYGTKWKNIEKGKERVWTKAQFVYVYAVKEEQEGILSEYVVELGDKLVKPGSNFTVTLESGADEKRQEKHSFTFEVDKSAEEQVELAQLFEAHAVRGALKLG